MKLSDRVELIEVEATRSGTKGGRRRTAAAAGTENWGQMKRRVRDALLEELGPKLYQKTKPEELKATVMENLDAALEKAGVSVSLTQRAKFAAEVAADLLGYGPLEELLADPTLTEIM
jgi:pilus assembly protein CpaF